MPVVVLYKEKSIPVQVADDIASKLASVTQDLLEAKIEVRIIEPVSTYNANEIHLEMQFRDFGEWKDDQLVNYHQAAMATIGSVLKESALKCNYSFYILPSMPPRSIWAQDKSEAGDT